jgi:hypothetical protein
VRNALIESAAAEQDMAGQNGTNGDVHGENMANQRIPAPARAM